MSRAATIVVCRAGEAEHKKLVKRAGSLAELVPIARESLRLSAAPAPLVFLNEAGVEGMLGTARECGPPKKPPKIMGAHYTFLAWYLEGYR